MVDILILTVLVTGLLLGFKSGLVRQVIGLAGLLAAAFLGTVWAQQAGSIATAIFGVAEEYASWVGFGVVFLGVYIAAMVLSQFAMKLVKTLHLSSINRMAGGIFGVLKSVVLLGVLAMVLARVDLPPEDMRNGSQLYGPLVQITELAWSHIDDA